MSTVLREYSRFMNWLNDQETSDDVKRLANIILEKISDLIPLGTTHRGRSKALVPYATDQWEQTSPVLSIPDDTSFTEESAWTQLYQLIVGPFRGFVESETFDLQKPITLIYGANGAGKSSICEALEYAFLGEVSEASVKRLQVNQYFTNIWAGNYEPPSLTALNSEGQSLTVVPNEEEYRFCFIEKNRIDTFSRLASKTPAEKTKLISTLFGVDQFFEFVRNFSDDLEPQLDLTGAKAQQLNEAKKELRTAEETVAKESEKKNNFLQQEQTIVEKSGLEISYEKLKEYIGSQENPGHLDKLNKQLEEGEQTIIGVTRADCDTKLRKLLDIDEELKNKQSNLHEYSSQVSFQQLFEAVKKLQDEILDRCPACDTPLQGETSVVSNPYDKARDGLADLTELAKLQNEIKNLEEQLNVASAHFHNVLKKMSSHSEIIDHQTIETRLVNQRWWDSLKLNEEEQQKLILDTASAIERLDQQAVDNNSKRTCLRQERDHLMSLSHDIIALEAQKSTLVQEVQSARELIERFERENQQLIQEVEAERSVVMLHRNLKKAYDEFLALLKSYSEQLPGTLLADLGETTKNLYNAFNRQDREEDKLAQLWLPTKVEEKIEIAFCGSPETRCDPLQILSEGHIRCLGLALLVAKNIKQNCPVLIFDDAVNAIDDDHRDGIWRTLFEDHWLSGKQIILTCHGREFIKVIQQGLGANRVKNDCTYYELFPHDGSHHPVVDASPPTKNYVLSAKNYLIRQDMRNALSESRRALEGLSQRLWKWLSNQISEPVKLSLRRPGAKPELRNLCEQLKKLLNKQHFSHERKEPLLSALNELLGVNGSSPEWSYLNSGTHEDDRSEEFEQGTVKRIVEAITEIDNILS